MRGILALVYIQIHQPYGLQTQYNIAVVFLCKIIYTGIVWDRQLTKQRMET